MYMFMFKINMYIYIYICTCLCITQTITGAMKARCFQLSGTHIFTCIYIYIHRYTHMYMYVYDVIYWIYDILDKLLSLFGRTIDVDRWVLQPEAVDGHSKACEPMDLQSKECFFFFFGAQLGDCDDQMWYLRKLQWWFDMDWHV